MPGLDFSFAGLKTALLYKVRDLGEEETARRAADLAASYEHAIVEALIMRVERALAAEPEPRLAIGGGVAANRLLRERAAALGVPVQDPAARAVHRQRGDDRLRRPLRRAGRVPGLPGVDAYAPRVITYAAPGCHLCDDARGGARARTRQGAVRARTR